MKLIAETAWHHDGDYKFFKKLVKSIIDYTSASYIKFHITLDVDEYIHKDHSAYKWVKEKALTEAQWMSVLRMVIENGKKLMLLFNDMKAIDFGMEYNPEIVEIHSVCLNDIKLLKYLNSKLNKNTKVVLGVGGSNIYEVENAINILETNNIVLMHGFQNYPTQYEDINFNKIKRLMTLFPDFEHGYADHTGWNNPNNTLITVLGAALGMQYIEKHVTIEYGKERVDWNAAISIEMFNELEEKLEILNIANGDGLLRLSDGEKAYSVFGPMKKAAILNKDVKKGELLQLNGIDFKRTSQISDLSQLDILNSFGKKYTKDLLKGHCIIKTDLE